MAVLMNTNFYFLILCDFFKDFICLMILSLTNILYVIFCKWCLIKDCDIFTIVFNMFFDLFVVMV